MTDTVFELCRDALRAAKVNRRVLQIGHAELCGRLAIVRETARLQDDRAATEA